MDHFEDSNRRLAAYAQQREELKSSIPFEGFKPLTDVGKIALVCIAKNEDPYINEFIDYHLKLGVDHIFIYENDWRSKIVREEVTTIPFDGPTRQIYAYNDFLFTHKGFDWAVFIDVDEFVVLKKHRNLQEFLRDYGNIPKMVDGIAMSWMTFGDNNAPPEGSVLERFTMRGEKPERHIKLIVRLNGDRLMMGPHHSYGFWIDTNGQVGSGQNNFEAVVDVIQVNHYFCKTRGEFEKKVARGRADWYKTRTLEDFDFYNKNEVEDLTALNFYRNGYVEL